VPPHDTHPSPAGEPAAKVTVGNLKQLDKSFFTRRKKDTEVFDYEGGWKKYRWFRPSCHNKGVIRVSRLNIKI
jgi:hypothetical protein